jgi:hypothetical protein
LKLVCDRTVEVAYGTVFDREWPAAGVEQRVVVSRPGPTTETFTARSGVVAPTNVLRAVHSTHSLGGEKGLLDCNFDPDFATTCAYTLKYPQDWSLNILKYPHLFTSLPCTMTQLSSTASTAVPKHRPPELLATHIRRTRAALRQGDLSAAGLCSGKTQMAL